MTANHETQTAPGARAAVIKLGLDVHASSMVVVQQLDAQMPQPAQRFTPEQFPAFVRRQLERADTVHSCYEAGPFGYVLHRRLAALGAEKGSRKRIRLRILMRNRNINFRSLTPFLAPRGACRWNIGSGR